MTKQKEKSEQKKQETIQDEKNNANVRDQAEKKYYYDDAHGYEIYKPETDEEENENK